MIINRLLRGKGEILIIGIVLLLSLVTVSRAAKLKVKVKAEKAYIHLWPDVKSQIVGRVPLGTILDLKGKVGKWYWVDLPPDQRAIVRSGYIHQRFAEEAKEGEKEKVSKIKKITKEEPKYKGQLVTLRLKNADIRDVIMYLCSIGGLNVVFDPGVSGKVTCDLKDVPWDQALDIILKVNKLGKVIEGNVLRAGKTDILTKGLKDKKKF